MSRQHRRRDDHPARSGAKGEAAAVNDSPRPHRIDDAISRVNERAELQAEISARLHDAFDEEFSRQPIFLGLTYCEWMGLDHEIERVRSADLSFSEPTAISTADQSDEPSVA